MLPKIKCLVIIALVLCIFFQYQDFSNAGVIQHSEIIRKVENAFRKASSDFELLSILLDFETIIDPNINVEEVRIQVNEMTEKLQVLSSPEEKTTDRISVLSNFLYSAGSWNNNKPFQYDFDDPLGTKISNKLVANYIKSKKGNCVSMPMLYMILARNLGLDATLSAAPLHYFIMVKDAHCEEYYSVEATHKGQIARKGYYKTHLAISDLAITQGVYLQPLNKKEIVAAMAILLSEYFAEQQQWSLSIEIAKIAIENYPNYAYAMLKVGNGYYKLLSAELKIVGKTPNQEQKSYLDFLYNQNLYWFNKAEEIGWNPPSKKQNEEYLKSVTKHQNLAKEQTREN